MPGRLSSGDAALRANLPVPQERGQAVAPAIDGRLPVAATGECRAADLAQPWPLHRLAGLPSRRRPPARVIAFIVIVALPMAIAAVYYLAIAADQYVCEFRFDLRSAAATPASPAALWFDGTAGSPASLDTAAIVQYIESRAIIDDLQPRLDLRRIFSRPQADRLARLDRPVSIEGLVRYWRHQVDAFDEPIDGTIVVRVRAFTPGDALAVARAIAAAAQKLVDGLSVRARDDALRGSRAAADRAALRLQTALARLSDFRDAHRVIDPGEAAAASNSLADRVRSEIVRAKAERQTLMSYLRDDTPALRLLTARIDALETQWRTVSRGVAGSGVGGNAPLSQAMGNYDELEADKTFAETAYVHALAALDRARRDADRQQVYIATFVPPSLPEEALYPRRWRSFGIVSLAAFALWVIGCLGVQSVRDHL